MIEQLNRREFLKYAVTTFLAVGGAVLGSLGGLAQAAASSGRRPNVVLILADDLGWVDTSFTGSTFYRTPNIERLAKRGVFLPNAYAASPLCSPTRASIMTGQNPARVGITSPACHVAREVFEVTTQPKAPAYERQRSCTTITRLKHEYYTLAEALKDAGYATGHFGKWHLGREPYTPLQQGFDVDVPHWPGPGPAGSFVAPWKFANFKPRTPKEHIEDRMGDEAVAFMEKHKNRPFFLNYWQFSVHAPFDAKEELIADYRERVDPDNPQRSATYAAMVHSLDDNVGKIIDTLDRLGIADNTVIIFYSDNGGNMYNEVDETTPTSNSPLRGGKATMYEGGIRVPAIVVWPGVVRGRTRNEALVQSEDLYPTITAMAGVAPKPGQACDGLNMEPALRGEKPLRDAVFCFFPHAPKVPDWQPPSVCVRQGDWKLIRIFHDGDGKTHRYELYNLRNDIGERRNLAAEMPDKVKALDALIDEFLADTGAVVPQPNPDYDPSAAEVVAGWKAGNARTRISFDRRRLAAHHRAFSDTPVLVTAEPLALPPGRYGFEIRMESFAAGNGAVSCRTARGQVGMAAHFEVLPDRKWRDYRADLVSEQPIAGLQLTPCSATGTVLIKWARLRDASGKLVKEWRFDKAPPKPRRQPVVGGWQAGPNGHATCRLRGGALHVTATKGDPMIMTARSLEAGPGEYTFSIRMKAQAKGGGQVFGRPANRGYQRGSGRAFAVRHDAKWYEYDVKLKFDHSLYQVRLDPCAGAGRLEIDWLRLRDAQGKLVREWSFDTP